MNIEKQKIGFPIPQKLTEQEEQQPPQMGTIQSVQLELDDIPDSFIFLPYLEGYIKAEEEGNYLENPFALRLLKACAERIAILEQEIYSSTQKRKAKKK